MANGSRSSDTDKQTSGVTIGDVEGGIHDAVIAGRDVSIGQRITNFFLGSTEQQRAQRNRRAMLELVRSTWVKGVLEQSLHGAAMIELGLEEQADAVERPWDMVLQTPDQPNRPLPQGKKTVKVFDEMNRALLILGEPGSGKTTMLLELARDTIAHAEGDLTQPIPVVFNLSSWAEKRQPIAEWLVNELNFKYNIPRRVARPWVENEDLLLLLDGLDEVKLEHREACVKTINDFRQEHGLTPLVVCSRVADYEVLTTRLKLQGAVLLQLLTPEQIDQYLEGAGIELLAVRRTLQHDPTLQELAQSPLLLSIMTLAYRGMSVEGLKPLASIEARRRHLLDTYVQRMFERRGIDKRYSPKQTIHWLAWLAQKMSQHAQAVFLIERMQPSWSRAGAGRVLYAIIPSLIVGLYDVLMGGLVGVLIGWLGDHLIGRLFAGVFCGLVVGLVYGLFIIRPGLALASIEPVEMLKWSWKEGGKGLIGGLVFGLVGGLIGGLILGLIVGLVGGPIHEVPSFMLFLMLMSGLILGPFLGLAGGLIGGLIGGLNYMRIETRVVPNQGIRRSMRNAAIVWLAVKLGIGLTGGLVFGLFGLLVGELLSGLTFGLLVGLSFGLIFGPIVELRLGGLAVIQHLALRFILWRNGYIPWNYARFLDYAVKRIFLRKVGGGYIFVHRLLMEHFAAMNTEEAT